MSRDFRKETDALGERELPQDAYYGINTLRARENFNVSSFCVHRYLIWAIAGIKKAAAETNRELDLLPAAKAEVIKEACDDVMAGRLDEHLTLDALQGGAGTSTNMMVNEIIANRALEILGKNKGEYDYIHPNDDVNRGQSTNDVYPTALRLAVVRLLDPLTEAVAGLQDVLQEKEKAFSSILKLGRTQLQDAVPVTLGQEFGAYAEAVARDRWRLYKIGERLKKMNLGGTALGTGLNTSRSYIFKINRYLREFTGIHLAHAENMIDFTQNQDIFVEISGLLKSAAVNLQKLANDLRLLASGPDGGIGEIRLPAVQAGSSIMPGKVNPVICEMINQVAFEVISADGAITAAAGAGQLELNAFLPLVAHKLLNNMEIMRKGIDLFVEKCITGIEADREACRRNLEKSMAPVTALVPELGYDRCCELAREARKKGVSIAGLVREKDLIGEERLEELLSVENMTRPGQ